MQPRYGVEVFGGEVGVTVGVAYMGRMYAVTVDKYSKLRALIASHNIFLKVLVAHPHASS